MGRDCRCILVAVLASSSLFLDVSGFQTCRPGIQLSILSIRSTTPVVSPSREILRLHAATDDESENSATDDESENELQLTNPRINGMTRR